MEDPKKSALHVAIPYTPKANKRAYHNQYNGVKATSMTTESSFITIPQRQGATTGSATIPGHGRSATTAENSAIIYSTTLLQP